MYERNNAPWSNKGGGQLAVCFTPPYYPAKLTNARFLIGASGVPATEFRVHVYAGSDSTGPARDDLLASEVRAAASAMNEWVEAYHSAYGITIKSGDVFVAMEWAHRTGR